MAGRMPFHESIVQAIADVEDKDGLQVLASLLLTTEIPANHTAIQNALRAKMLQVGAGGPLFRGVLQILDNAIIETVRASSAVGAATL